MELPQRPKDDRFLRPGQYRQLESALRRQATRHDIPALFVYAFDPRTRLGPFYHLDRALLPGAPRAIAAALVAAGFRKLRVVLQSWNPRLRPSCVRIDGRPPELLLVSSMQIHSASAYKLIKDAWALGDDRPLIIVGGPKAIYEPWDFFATQPGQPEADVVVTGEEYVLLELLNRILEYKHPREHLRGAFNRARAEGLLDDIPGLVFRPANPSGVAEHVLDTGPQRLLQDLDELPICPESLEHFEPPHKRRELSDKPLPAAKLGRHFIAVTVLNTRGCKFRCHYCPIPAYNQFSFRTRSPERFVEEIKLVRHRTGISYFFGADDNFFNDRVNVERMFDLMARSTIGKKPFRDAITYMTEATEYDVYKHQDLLPLARQAGLRALWIGIEDLTAKLVKKGQGPERTKSIFKTLLKHGIAPMAMLIHYDEQPLWTWRGLQGLLNQVRFLWKAGALTCQITLLTPSVGSKSYEEPFREGKVLKAVGGKPVEDYQFDGNHCVATASSRPWVRQLDILAAYLAFYNPMNLLGGVIKWDNLWLQRIKCQLMGMAGLAQSVYEMRDWLHRLITGPIERYSEPPRPAVPVVRLCRATQS